MDFEPRKWLSDWEARVLQSPAHNSRVYENLTTASLSSISEFLQWDSVQPPFNLFLRGWIDLVPLFLRTELGKHIEEEEREDHAGLFRRMLSAVLDRSGEAVKVDQARLRELNYTFSAECTRERDYGFFLGGFWATEIMSAKRCGQLYQGLLRHGFDEETLLFLTLHRINDHRHQEQIKESLILPAVNERGKEIADKIALGVTDRLKRSADYLEWYDTKNLG